MTPTEYQQLVEFLGHRFAEIDGRFAQIDQRFARVDERFNQMDARFNQMDDRFVEIQGRLTQMDGRFVEFDGRLLQLDGRIAQLDGRLAQLDRRLTGLEDRVAELRRETLGHFDELYRRLERREQEHQAITQALRRIESGLADERSRREMLDRDLGALKDRVTTLQARIEEIEERLGRRGD
jgi:chromosome segregation ATPase